MKSVLSQPHFHNEEAAFAKLESIVWPGGEPVCPRCGGLEDTSHFSDMFGLFRGYGPADNFDVGEYDGTQADVLRRQALIEALEEQ